MQPKTTAKDFFICLSVMIGMYVSAVAYLFLAFGILDHVFPMTGEYLGSNSGIRSAMATLIIFFPSMLYLMWVGIKEVRLHPEKKDTWVRKWTIYLALFVSGLTMAIDLATLIYRFLGADDLGARFLLKVFFVLLVAFCIFYSSLSSLKRQDFNNIKDVKIRISIASLFVLGTIVWGFFIVGTPGEQQATNFDMQRINDLASIQNQIVYTQWENKGTVPESLAMLADPISGFVVPTDPQTGAAYSYAKISANSFQLCATFETVAGTSTSGVTAPALYPDPTTNENWQHTKGNVCFNRTIDPSLYKVNPVTK